MGAKGKAIAVGVLGAGLIGGLLLQGSGRAEAAEKPKKKKPKAKSLSSTVLANKWADKFGIPRTLVLATIYAQSSDNMMAQKANNRGGAWGLGQVTLATAKEIYPRVKGVVPPWDGTGKGLLQPDLNVALTAYYLSLWYKRYQKNRLAWMLAAYAYVLGPGRVQAVMADVNGKLPSPLPADFASTKARYQAALNQPALKGTAKPAVSGVAEALYGKALSAQVSPTTTGNQARNMFGKMTASLGNAYATLKNYDPKGIAQKSGIDAGSVKAAKDYLDNTNAMLAKYYKQMPATDQVLTADQLNKLKVAVSTSSVAVKTVDDMFGTSWGSELFGEITKAGKMIIAKVADTVGLSKTSAIIAVGGIAAAAVLILAIKK
jgi:hypothetical protein